MTFLGLVLAIFVAVYVLPRLISAIATLVMVGGAIWLIHAITWLTN